MDRTEEVNQLKKEIFTLQLKMAMQKNPEELLSLSLEAQKLQRKVDALEEEIKNAAGQVGFAFTDLIEESKLEVKKGR